MFKFLKFFKRMATFKINSKTITGKTITIINGKITIDGKDVTPEGKEINISVEGNVEKIEADAFTKLIISGNAGNIRTSVGDIEVKGSVSGSVDTQSGDIDCGDVGGNASTMSGDINCGSIKGNASTMAGDIKCKK